MSLFRSMFRWVRSWRNRHFDTQTARSNTPGLPVGTLHSRKKPMPPPQLSSLLPFVSSMAAADFRFGEWAGGETRNGVTQVHFFALSPVAEAFVTAADEGHWVRPEIDWATWAAGERYAALRRDPSAMDGAGVGDIAHMLTTLVRGNRFNEGLLATAWKEGLITRLLTRISDLAHQSDGPRRAEMPGEKG